MKKMSRAPFFLLLIFCIFVISCTGQENKNVREIKPQSTSTTNSDTTWTDPLFFIEGQLCAWVRNIFQDSRGVLWFATNHYGLMRYDGDSLRYFNEKDGLGRGRVTGIVEDKQGNLWFGTYSGLSKYDPSREIFNNFSNEDGLVDNEIWSLIIDRNGLFWIGTSEGISTFDGEKFSPFPIPKPELKERTSIISYNRVSCILEDQNGRLWFGTDGFGLCLYDPKSSSEKFVHYTKENGLCDHNVADLMEDREGNIWIGTMYGGVSRYAGQGFTNFTREGLISGEEAYGFFEDEAGNIWFAAENHGVYRFDGKTFTNFYKNEALPTNGILSILEDKEGRFWLGGWGGLFRYSKKEKLFYSVTKDGPWN